MGQQQRFRCYIIGEGSLPVQCGEVLLGRGHQVLGVISSDSGTREWANEKHIPIAVLSTDLASILEGRPFEYLFSIVNGLVLPAEILRLPLKCAINFHDSLIPKYTGTHATSWALMNQEKTHGISWHTMAERVDAGDILKQRTVEIMAHDTAFTLNAKCYEAALGAFSDLVEELELGTVTPRPQDQGGRTFFSRYKRPEAACTLSWEGPASKISAFARALDFGPYRSPIGLPKVYTGDSFVLASSAEVSETMSTNEPGTVTNIFPDHITVSTTTNDISLSKLSTVDGEPLDILDAANRYQWYEGARLPSLGADQAQRITEMYSVASRNEEFWVERLSALQPVELPYGDRTGVVDRPDTYARAEIATPKAFATLIKRQPGWKLADLLAAAFVAYLSRIAGPSGFDIGMTSQELHESMDGMDGMDALFASCLPLRVDTDTSRPFTSFYEAFQQRILELSEHRTFARDLVVRYPALASLRGLQPGIRYPAAIAQVSNLENQQLVFESDMALVVQEDGLSSCLVYNINMLGQEVVDQIMGQLTTFMNGIARNPEQKVCDLPLMNEEERRLILEGFNNTTLHYPEDHRIHVLFEEQAMRTLEAEATAFKGEKLTYRELDSWADHIASQLISLGVGPDVPVAICVERSPAMVAGLLGILKAGGAYVPLDPVLPEERLAFMLDDCQAPVLITQLHLVERLPDQLPQVLYLEADGKVPLTPLKPSRPVTVTPDNLAYIIYTSGSTGRPKGALLPHRGVVNWLLVLRDTFGITERDRVLQKASLSFDVSVMECFLPLVVGGTLVLADPEQEFDTSYLMKLISEERVSFAHFVASMLSAFLEAPGVEVCTSLRNVVCGGEVVPTTLVSRFYQHLEGKLTASYGPTEASIGATLWPCPRDFAGRSVPIGPPVANIKIYVLDEQLQPVPVGLPGELCISGGLARGYLNRPELTAEKFVPDPFSRTPNNVLYRTGDKARYLPDGNIDFLGRFDRQVKIRGLRIELGEIETVLGQSPVVRDSAVVAQADQHGDPRLVAYVVPQGDQNNTISDMRDYLKVHLPDYMVPSAYVILDALPTNTSGKLDYRALPAVSISRPAVSAPYAAPRNQQEQDLQRLFSEVLGLDQVGIHDNFFEMGGHSLLATQLVARIRDTLSVELPLRSIFQTPTIARVAEWFQDTRSADQLLQAPPLVPTSHAIPSPLSYQQERFWKMIRDPSRSREQLLHFGLKLVGRLDVQALERSFNDLVERHQILHSTFGPEDGGIVQLPGKRTDIPLPVVDLSHLSAVDREKQLWLMLAEAAEQPLDLTKGPLLQLELVRLADEEHVLSIEISHMVFDAWSKNLLYKDMLDLYASYLSGAASQLPELGLEHSDFAHWQRRIVADGVIDWQKDYWMKKLGGGFPTVELATDRPRPETQSLPNLMVSGSIPDNLARAIKDMARRKGVTLFAPMLAAFNIFLNKYTGQEDLVVTTLFSSRSRGELDGMIGPLLNRINLRTDLSGDPTFQELFESSLSTFMEAHYHKDYPFEKLEEDLRSELGSRPLQSRIRFWLVDNSGFDPKLVSTELGGLAISEMTQSIMQTGARGGPDLSLAITLAPDELGEHWLYRSDLFEESSIHKMIAEFHALLEGIVAHPEHHISELLRSLK